MKNGSVPNATASGSGASGDSCDILLAREKSKEGPPLCGRLIADSAAQHRIPRFEGIENGALCHGPPNVERHIAVHSSERPQMRGRATK